MVRLDPPEVGGYAVPRFVLDRCGCLFSYGIGTKYRADFELIEGYQKPIYRFDHTISHWTLPSEINHTSEGLGFGEGCRNFIEYCRQDQVVRGLPNTAMISSKVKKSSSRPSCIARM